MLIITIHRDGDHAVLETSCACGQRKRINVEYHFVVIDLPEVAKRWVQNHAACTMHPNTEKRRES